MNTQINYLYRDACNYKKFSSVTLSGEITEEQEAAIMGSLHDGEFFLPGQVGLPDDNRYSGSVDDHPWFELENIELTGREPTTGMTLEELVGKFREARGNWQTEKYYPY